MAEITFHAQVHEEDGSYWASVDELPGCFASGFSLEELQEALIEAIQACLPDGVRLGEARVRPDGDPESSTRQLLVCA
jgi:predicted RNase H-like HicB family nuclease